MLRQASILRQAFDYLMGLYLSHEPGDKLQEIAHTHGVHGLNIRPELYEVWMESLLETVKDSDPKFDKNVELAWKLVLSPGIVYLKHHSSDD